MSQVTTFRRPKLSALLSGAAVLGLIFYSHIFAGDLDFTIGSGYEYISSDFYLLSMDTLAVDPDSLESLKRSTDASNELSFFGKLRFNHKFSESARLEIYDRSSFSSESFKSNLDMRLYAGFFKINNYLNLRNLKNDGDESLSHDYLTNLTSASARPGLGHGFYVELKNSFEFTRYNDPSGYFYDYNYNKLNFAIEKEFGFEGRLRVGYRNDTKKVSDSTRLDYNRDLLIFEAEYAPSWNFSARLNNELSLKDSKKEDDLEDGSLDNFELLLSYRPSFDFTLKFYNQLEYSSYDVQDFVYYNQYYWKSDFRAGYSLSDYFQISLTPHYRRFSAENEAFGSQDFYEYSFEPGVEFIYGTSLWLDLEFEFGRRIYPDKESTLFSDHNIYQFNILLDATLTSHIAFNLIGSIDWERHDLKTDNTALYLLTSGLEYRF